MLSHRLFEDFGYVYGPPKAEILRINELAEKLNVKRSVTKMFKKWASLVYKYKKYGIIELSN
jgi:Mn-dependent DtxR family transcriptional regulator